MATIRFTQVVKSAGRPEVHLVLTDPRLDRVLRAATQANRVMTIHRSAVGNKADFGTVGFVKEPQSQVLIFPRSLARFEGGRVVGIQYEQLSSGALADRSPSPPAAPKRSAAGKPVAPGPPAHRAKIVPFPTVEAGGDARKATMPEARSNALAKRSLQRALKALEDNDPPRAQRVLEDLLKSLSLT